MKKMRNGVMFYFAFVIPRARISLENLSLLSNNHEQMMTLNNIELRIPMGNASTMKIDFRGN